MPCKTYEDTDLLGSHSGGEDKLRNEINKISDFETSKTG